VIEKSPNKLAIPTFHIRIFNTGKEVRYVDNAPVIENDEDSFVVRKITTLDGDSEDIEVTAGVRWSKKIAHGFYMEAANGGSSPLPASEFQKCIIEDQKF
jgi:hypothetical protein